MQFPAGAHIMICVCSKDKYKLIKSNLNYSRPKSRIYIVVDAERQLRLLFPGGDVRGQRGIGELGRGGRGGGGGGGGWVLLLAT